MNPRVAFVITDSGIGGSEVVLLDLLKNFDREKVTPCGIAILKNKREMVKEWEAFGIPIVSFGMNRFPSPRLIWRVSKLLKEWKPDVVHAILFHSIHVARLAHFFNRSFKLVTAPCINYEFAPKLIQWVDPLTKSYEDLMVSESRYSQNYFIEKLGYRPEKTVYVANGVDTNKFKFSAEGRERVRQEWGVADDEILLGGIGRLHDQKGFDYFLEAMDTLKIFPVKHQAVLIGEGPLKEVLDQTIREKSLRVRLVGNRTDMVDVFSALDVFVLSSRYEGMPIVLLEALSMARPIVATAVNGTMDLAQDGENMILVRPQDPVALSIAMGLLLEKPLLRTKLSEHARRTAEEFSVEKMTRGFEEAYSSVLSGEMM